MKEKDFVAEMKDRYINGLRESCINSFHLNRDGRIITIGNLIDNFSYSCFLMFNSMEKEDIEIREYIQEVSR
jgi:hypothetical protein